MISFVEWMDKNNIKHGNKETYSRYLKENNIPRAKFNNDYLTMQELMSTLNYTGTVYMVEYRFEELVGMVKVVAGSIVEIDFERGSYPIFSCAPEVCKDFYVSEIVPEPSQMSIRAYVCTNSRILYEKRGE